MIPSVHVAQPWHNASALSQDMSICPDRRRHEKETEVHVHSVESHQDVTYHEANPTAQSPLLAEVPLYLHNLYQAVHQPGVLQCHSLPFPSNW